MGASDFSKLPHIGESLLRKEDYRFLTGAGQYTDDVVLAAQSHAVFVRSPHAHAKINSINVEAAKAARKSSPQAAKQKGGNAKAAAAAKKTKKRPRYYT